MSKKIANISTPKLREWLVRMAGKMNLALQ